MSLMVVVASIVVVAVPIPRNRFQRNSYINIAIAIIAIPTIVLSFLLFMQYVWWN
jgi:hypothetical protein